MTERPSLTVAPATVQPSGRYRTQGTSEADGTDWACSHSGSRWAQPGSLLYSGVLPASLLAKPSAMLVPANTSSAATSARSPIRRGLHRWIDTGWGGVGSRRTNSACRARPWGGSRGGGGGGGG